MKSFSTQYPNIACWIEEHDGRIEIGYDEMDPSSSMGKLIDAGGVYWQQEGKYSGLDALLNSLDAAAAETLQDIYGYG